MAEGKTTERHEYCIEHNKAQETADPAAPRVVARYEPHTKDAMVETLLLLLQLTGN